MKKNENGQPGQKPRPQKEKENHELEIVTYLFVGLFICLIGYLVYFDAVLSKEVINNPYNSRQESFADRVVRGSILSSDGTVLAETRVDPTGTETRYYPYGSMFSHVIGYSTRGKTGLESLGNFYLLTSNAFWGERITKEIREEKNIGDNLVTTLDLHLQQTAYDALGSHKGAVVVMEAETGKILAMVSKPDFDPNRINQDWDSLNDPKESESPLYNRASQGQYAPGSTFKIITLLEYMRENPNYGDFTFHCDGSYEAGNYTISCYGKKAHRDEDLKKAFAKSCNTAFSSIGLSLSESRLRETCESLLFNKELPVELPYSKSSFSLTEGSTPAEKMMTAIGQGETLVSPLHMTMIAGSIANRGLLMKPYFIDRIETAAGDPVKTFQPTAWGTFMTAQEADILKEYMEAVVEEGTGSKLSDLSFPVMGKTGTAEYSSDKSKSHAWFVGFSDTEEADIAVCVLVEEAGSGNEYAVPIARKIFDAWNLNLEVQ